MKKITRVELGDHIKKQRKYFGLSQNKVAEKVGVSRQCISRIERGENTYPHILNAVLNILCINIKEYKII